MRITLLNLCIAACWLSTTAAAVAEYRWTEVTKAATFCNRDGAGAVTFQTIECGYSAAGRTTRREGKAHVGYNDVLEFRPTACAGRKYARTPPTMPAFGTSATAADMSSFNNRMWIVGGDPAPEALPAGRLEFDRRRRRGCVRPPMRRGASDTCTSPWCMTARFG